MTLEEELNELRAKYEHDTEEAAADKAPQKTLGEMNALADRMSELREMKRVAEEQVSALSADLESIQKNLIDIMIEHELTSYKAPAGLISVTHHFSAKLPQGEDKVKCYEYLKSIGRFEDMASIHSQTFNSWVKEQYELAKERGEGEPKIPGVSDVKTLLRISFRRAK